MRLVWTSEVSGFKGRPTGLGVIDGGAGHVQRSEVGVDVDGLMIGCRGRGEAGSFEGRRRREGGGEEVVGVGPASGRRPTDGPGGGKGSGWDHGFEGVEA